MSAKSAWEAMTKERREELYGYVRTLNSEAIEVYLYYEPSELVGARLDRMLAVASLLETLLLDVQAESRS